MKRTLTQIYPNVWRLVAPNPSFMTGPGTNTYFIGGDEVVVVDPGPQSNTHLDNIHAALQTLNASVQSVIVTHHHSDHAGSAQQLANQLDVPLLSFRNPFRHGDELHIEGTSINIQHTPGHIYAHMCLYLVEEKLLLAGDLVAGLGTIVIIPPDGDMADYLASLRAMLALNVAAILPGHGPVIDAPQELLQEYIDHRLEREQQVLHWFSQGYETAQEIAAKIYADRPEALGVATLQTEAHLEKLRKEGRL